jgi:hypothetical protein
LRAAGDRQAQAKHPSGGSWLSMDSFDIPPHPAAKVFPTAKVFPMLPDEARIRKGQVDTYPELGPALAMAKPYR